MIELLYFARFREQLGCDSEQLDLADCSAPPVSVADLRCCLAARGEQWQAVFAGSRVLVAVNQEMAADDSIVKDGDEVGFFPPVTGG